MTLSIPSNSATSRGEHSTIARGGRILWRISRISPPGFSTGGFDNASGNYAGSDGTHSQQNAQSGAAVSQYDVACTRGRTK